jgi:protein TonB
MRPLELSADLTSPRLAGPEIALAPAPLSASPPLDLTGLASASSAPLKFGIGFKLSALVSAALHLSFIFVLLSGLSAAILPETDDLASAIEVDLVTLPAEAEPDPVPTASTASVAQVSAGENQPQPVELEEIPQDAPVVSETLPDLPPPPIEITQVAPDAPVIADDLPPLLAAKAVATEPEPLPPPPPKVEPPRLAPETPTPQKRAENKPAEKPLTKPQPEKPKVQKPKAKASSGNGGKSDADMAASAGGKPQKAAKASGSGSAEVAKYPGLVQRKLRRALRFPKGAGSARGDVSVSFVVAASGSVSAIKVVASSGHPVLDQAAVQTVQRAAPFPPIPADSGRSSWSFTMPLTFAR